MYLCEFEIDVLKMCWIKIIKYICNVIIIYQMLIYFCSYFHSFNDRSNALERYY